ncbi:hypothetical protein F5Y07DRAFT_325663 [Xylaria sp. FL0933]|nr:hypothetical protein F5Y07DRAFT_325663 [Xylaria sp. FL0933]
MSDSSHSPTTVSTSKRTACDRCRGHKLRCPQREFTTQPCGRCTRLGVYCVTTFQSPIGRPGKNAVSGHLRKLSKLEVTSTSVEPNTEQIAMPAPPIQPVGDNEAYPLMPICLPSPSINACDSSSMTTFAPLEIQHPGSEELDVDYMTYSTTRGSLMNLGAWPMPDNDSNVSSHINSSLSVGLEAHPSYSVSHTSNTISLNSDSNALAFELSEQWGSRCVGDGLHDTMSLIKLMESDGREATSSKGEQVLSS